MSERKVRMGIDVGGTHTKAVAIDNATHEIIGKSSVKTTHDDKAGVATGVVQAFKNCLKENDIDPKDVIFVAHSTTQATNALIEGDVAQVGVIGIGGKGPGGWIAKAQTNLKDIDLGSGRSIHLHNRYLVDDTLSDASVKAAIQELTGEGAQVIVASEVYGVDDMENENANAARKAMQALADYMGKTVEEVATQILTRAYEKIEPVITELAAKYRLEKDRISLVGVGGGAAALIGFCSDKMGLRYSIPENAEVISSIGVALAMVRDVVERVVPNPTPEDIRSIKAEAIDKAVESGATPDSVDVHIEIDPQTSKLTAIALGSTEVKTTDLLKECTREEAAQLAADDLKATTAEVKLEGATKNFFVYGLDRKNKHPLRILDKKRFIKVQRNDGKAVLCKAGSYRNIVSQLWEELAIYQQDAILRPDYYICAGARVMDFSGSVDLDKIMMLMEVEMQMINPSDDVIIVAAKNSL